MRLVVMGAYSLDYLQDHVIKSFSGIRSNGPLVSYTWNDIYASPMKDIGMPFSNDSLQKVFYIAPVRDRHALSVTWQIPSQIGNWKSKPCDYIAHLTGHEGKNSLLASLKAKSWVTACCAGVGEEGVENTTSYALFTGKISLFEGNAFLLLFIDDHSHSISLSLSLLRSVSFTLSEEGILYWKDIISALYQYVGMLRFYCQSEDGLPPWIYDELKSIYDVSHRYADEQSPEDYVVEFAEECSPCLNIPPERLLDASGLLFDYDPDTVRTLLDKFFTPLNARIDFGSTSFGRASEYEEDTSKSDYYKVFDTKNVKSETDHGFFDAQKAGAPHIEPIFGTPFWCESISASQLKEWESKAQPQMPPAESMLALPLQNQFIPTNFEMKSLPPSDSDHPLVNCSIKLQIPVGKRKEWFPATVIRYNSINNQILCAYEDEDEKWHNLDISSLDFPHTIHASDDFEGTLDGKNIKYRIVSLAVEGSKATLKFGDESDFHADCGSAFPAIPPATPPSRLPKLAYDTAELKMWHLQDRTFKRPIADLRLQLNCAEANKTCLHCACADLLVNLVSDAVTEISYMASVCELGSSFSSNETGISMRVHGFDDKLLELFMVMLEKLLLFRIHNAHDGSLPDGISEDRFCLVLETYRRSCINSGMKSQKLGSDTRIRCLRPGSFSAHQKFCAVQNLDVATFTSTVRSLLSMVGAVSLYHGNVDLDDARMARERILNLLRDSAPEGNNAGLARKKYPSQLVLQLPPKQLEIICPAKDPTESNTAVEVYIQVGKDNVQDRVMVDMLVEILYEPIYTQLRTKDQFGYDVSCASRWTHGIIGMVFCVVTPSRNADETVARIERFLLEYRQTVEDMSTDEFTEIMIGLANDKLNMFNSMPEETNHYWSEICEHRYKWEDHREEVLHLKTITKDEILKAYDEWLSPNNNKRRQLTVKIIASEGPAAIGRPDVKPDDVSDFNDDAVKAIHSACKNQTYGRVY
jgi:secreted Zn-dependent insulinase-like peptidase